MAETSGNDERATLRVYLGQAVALSRPSMLTGYVSWQQSMRGSRGDDAATLRADLEALRDEAVADGDTAATDLLDQCLASIGADTAEPETYLAPEHPLGDLARQYLDLLLDGSRREACDLVLDAVENGVTLQDLYLDVFQLVQWEMGRLWELNRVTVAQEHYVTAATQLVMSQLYPKLFEHPRIGRRVVVTCVAGDHHELAPRMVADLFELEGWDSYFLGADTPHDSVVATTKAQSPDILAVSATLTSHLPALRDLIAAIRADPETADVTVLVGGSIFNQQEDLWRDVGADGTAKDALSGVGQAQELVDRR